MARTKEFDTEEALEKAIRLFRDKGYNACSMQDVVDGLDLSRSSIYETFGDKRHLFLAALKKYQREGVNAIRHNLDTATDIRQAVRAIFYDILPSGLDNPSQKSCFMVNTGIELAPHDPEIAAMIQANRQEFEEILAAGIQKGQDAGQISQQLDALSIARFFNTVMSGLRVSATSGAADCTALENTIKIALSVL